MPKVFVALSVMFALTLSVGFALNARADEGLPQDGTSELSGNATSENLSDELKDPYYVSSTEVYVRDHEYGFIAVNENGQTYGSIRRSVDVNNQYHYTIRNEKGEDIDIARVDQLPDLLYCGTINGAGGYVYTKDLIDILESITGEPQVFASIEIPVFRYDGHTVIKDTSYSADPVPLEIPEAIRNQYPTPCYSFGVNENGQTYGPAYEGLYGDNVPDLIAAEASNGRSGYIYYTDFLSSSRSASNPAHAAQLMNEYQQKSVNAFCDYVYRETGIRVNADAFDRLFEENNYSAGFNHSWDRLSEQQQQSIINLLPEGYRTAELAQAAYTAAQTANYTSIPVYESDGITIVGEMIIQ
jgi:hypothetical protein